MCSQFQAVLIYIKIAKNVGSSINLEAVCYVKKTDGCSSEGGINIKIVEGC